MANQKILTFTLPIYWQQTTKKKVLCGMNAYRNWHYFTANKWKQEFHDLVANQISRKITFDVYELELDLFYKNPTMDGSNVAALMEKAALDSLQSIGVLKEDNVKFHKQTRKKNHIETKTDGRNQGKRKMAGGRNKEGKRRRRRRRKRIVAYLFRHSFSGIKDNLVN